MIRDGRGTESGDFVSLCFSARSKCLLDRMQIDCKVLPRPMSAKSNKTAIALEDSILTVTQDPMQLVLKKEGQPIDTVLLVLAERCIDLDRDLVFLDLGSIEELSQKLALGLTALQQLLRKTRRVRQACLNQK